MRAGHAFDLSVEIPPGNRVDAHVGLLPGCDAVELSFPEISGDPALVTFHETKQSLPWRDHYPRLDRFLAYHSVGGSHYSCVAQAQPRGLKLGP